MNTTANESDTFNMSEPLLVVTQVSLTTMVEPKFALLILAYATGKYLDILHVCDNIAWPLGFDQILSFVFILIQIF